MTPGTKRAYRVLWFGQFAAIAGLTVVVPLMPFYLAGLGIPAADVPLWTGVALAAPAVTQLLTGPLWGLVGDRYGHKAMVVRAHAGLAIAVAVMALAQTPEQFLLCRLLQGACGGVVSATATYASSLAAEERRGRALGGLSGATGAGALLGPLLGSMLAGRFGYGALFISVAALLALSSVLAVVLLPPARHTGRGKAAGPSLRAVAGRLIGVPAGRSLLIAGLATQAAIYALVVVFASQVERITPSITAATIWVGGLQALTWAGSLVGGPWWGRRNDRHSSHRGFAIAAVACAVAVVLQVVPASPEWLLPLRFAQGFCFAAFAQSVLHASCRLAQPEGRGTAIGVSTGVLDAGQVIGPLLGALAAATLPAPAVFGIIAALLCCAGAAALLGDRRPAPRPVTIRELAEVNA